MSTKSCNSEISSSVSRLKGAKPHSMILRKAPLLHRNFQDGEASVYILHETQCHLKVYLPQQTSS